MAEPMFFLRISGTTIAVKIAPITSAPCTIAITGSGMRVPARRMTMLIPKIANAATPSCRMSAPTNQVAMPKYLVGLTSLSSTTPPRPSRAIPRMTRPVLQRRTAFV